MQGALAVFLNAVKDDLQPRFKKCSYRPEPTGYNRVLNEAQSGFIIVFFTQKNSYKSQPIGSGKTQYRGWKNTAIGDLYPRLKKSGNRPRRGYCRAVKAMFVNVASCIFRVYSYVFCSDWWQSQKREERCECGWNKKLR